MHMNSVEKLIESLMGSSHAALSRRLTNNREKRTKRKLTAVLFCIFSFEYKMLLINNFVWQIISLNSEFNTLSFPYYISIGWLVGWLVSRFVWFWLWMSSVSLFVEFNSKSHFELLSFPSFVSIQALKMVKRLKLKSQQILK